MSCSRWYETAARSERACACCDPDRSFWVPRRRWTLRRRSQRHRFSWKRLERMTELSGHAYPSATLGRTSGSPSITRGRNAVLRIGAISKQSYLQYLDSFAGRNRYPVVIRGLAVVKTRDIITDDLDLLPVVDPSERAILEFDAFVWDVRFATIFPSTSIDRHDLSLCALHRNSSERSTSRCGMRLAQYCSCSARVWDASTRSIRSNRLVRGASVL